MILFVIGNQGWMGVEQEQILWCSFAGSLLVRVADIHYDLVPLQLDELAGVELEHVALQVEQVVALLVLQVVDLVQEHLDGLAQALGLYHFHQPGPHALHHFLPALQGEVEHGGRGSRVAHHHPAIPVVAAHELHLMANIMEALRLVIPASLIVEVVRVQILLVLSPLQSLVLHARIGHRRLLVCLVSLGPHQDLVVSEARVLDHSACNGGQRKRIPLPELPRRTSPNCIRLRVGSLGWLWLVLDHGLDLMIAQGVLLYGILQDYDVLLPVRGHFVALIEVPLVPIGIPG